MGKTLRIASLLPFLERFGIIITLVLLPIDRLPYLHRIPLGLGFISLVALVIASIWRLWQQYHKQGWKSLRQHMIVAGILVLPVIGFFLSSLDAIDRDVAFRATTLLAVVCLRAFCFFVLLRANDQLWPIVRKTIYIVTAIVVAFGLFQYFFDTWGAHTTLTDLKNCCTSNSTYVFPRVHSTALEPLYFDHFLMIPLWILSFDFMRNKSSRKNKRLVVLFVLTATLFILTIARSATIGIICAAIIFALGIRAQPSFKATMLYLAKLWGLAAAVAVLLVLMSGLASMVIDKEAQYNTKGFGSLSKFGSHAIDFDDGSSKTRYELWPRAIDYAQEDILDGVGPDNSRVRINVQDYENGVPLNRLQPFNNDVLGLVVDTGLIGVLSFLPLVGAVLYTMYRQYKEHWKHTYAAFVLILVGMAVQGNFFHSILLTRTWFVIGVLLVMLPSHLPRRKTG